MSGKKRNPRTVGGDSLAGRDRPSPGTSGTEESNGTDATRLLGLDPDGHPPGDLTPAQEDVLPKGAFVEDLEVIGLLGRGGFGATYLVRQGPRSRLVIKEYFPRGIARRDGDGIMAPSSDDTAVDYFEGLADFAREAQRLRWLKHPNIPTVSRFITARGTAYFTMPYLLGGTFARELRAAGRITQRRFEKVFSQLLDALGYVHDAGMLHRDLKPANIYISDKDVAFLLDFGSARRAMERRSIYLGEPVSSGYSPIEQYRLNAPHTPATDIYAMAATMYLAMTGERPPDAPERLRDDPYQPAAAVAGDAYRDGLCRAVDAALSVRQEHRPESVYQWRKLLGI